MAQRRLANPHWQRNPEIVRRVERVSALYDKGMSALAISNETGIPYTTVREDLKRVERVWANYLGKKIEAHRGTQVRRLGGIMKKALEAFEEDRRWNMAVLFDVPIVMECPGGVVHRLPEREPNPADPTQPQLARPQPEQEAPDFDGNRTRARRQADRDVADMLLEEVFGGPEFGNPGEPCPRPHLVQYRVWRDSNGKAEYRHSQAQHLDTARKALMDQAKLLGLVVDKVAPTDSNGNDLASYLQSLLTQEPAPPTDGPVIEHGTGRMLQGAEDTQDDADDDDPFIA